MPIAKTLKQKVIKNFSIVLLIAVFILSPLKFDSSRFQSSKAQWTSGTIINSGTTWSGNLSFDEPVFVQKNATLTIEKGTNIKFNNGSFLEIDYGAIIAKGSQEEKITFSSGDESNFYIYFFGGDETTSLSFFLYVEISGGGYIVDPGNAQAFHREKSNKVINTAYADEFFADGVPTFIYGGGKIHIENSRFHENKYADVGVNAYFEKSNENDYLEIVNSNFENNTNGTAVISNVDCQLNDCSGNILLKDNWYGNVGGPTQPDSLFSKGEKISGTYKLEGWKYSPVIADPTILIPGIMGSSKVLGEWKLDPITHVYNDLSESFQKNGYTKGKNFFEFPYDWRNNNETSAQYLRSKIEEVINNTKVSKVDLVAHSMGGLVARYYIENNDHNDTVDQLITIGTPHRGAPKAYLRWEAGEGFFGWKEKLAQHYFENEASHNGYDDLYKYIQEKITSVRELLPDYDYLYDVSRGEMRTYFDGYPRNVFLEELNSAERIKKLENVDFTNIAGVLENNQSTISKIRVVNSAIDGKWDHGMPENFYNNDTDQGLESDTGDETVPKFSSKNIPANITIELASSHGDLPTKSQCEIIKELTGKNDCVYVNDFPDILETLFVSVFSSIDIQVVAPDGKRTGKDFETGEILNEIKGAYYTGYDTENEFLTIPNPLDGEYKILVQGTGDGEYRIEVGNISKGPNNSQEAVESTGIIKGIAAEGKTEEKTIEIKGNDVITKNEDIALPTITVVAPRENWQYLNNQVLAIDYQIEDNLTLPENIKTEVYFDGEKLENKKIDLSLQNFGNHVIRITAVDEAQNQSGKEIIFEIITNPEAIIANINHYFDLGMIKKENEKRTLIKEAERIKRIREFLEKTQNNHKIPEKTGKLLVERIKIHLSRYIDFIVRYINGRPEKFIAVRSKELLIESFNYLKN